MHTDAPRRAEPQRRPNEVSPTFTLLVSLSLVLVFVVVVLSAYIRLADAGLGCADWPGCFGDFSPARDVQPGRSLAEGGPLVPPGAARTFHRVAATVLGFFVLAIAYLAVRRRRTGAAGPLPALSVLALTLFLSVLGYVTPSPLVPAVTVGNVLGGMTMLAVLWWISQRTVDRIPPDDVPARGLRPWVRLALLLVVAQIALGAWVSGSFAGPACPNLTGCEDWRSLEGFVRGFAPGRALGLDAQGRVMGEASQRTVHMVHRLGAGLTMLYLLWLAWRARAAGGRLRITGYTVFALVLLETGLGLMAVATALPLALATLHSAGAAVLLLAVTNLNHLVTPAART